MTIAGIIAEYNPYHNGHDYMIQKVRKETGADYVIAVMSGDFTQRGIPGIADKHTRAKMAVSCGADAVFELPVRFATASAGDFAMGAVSFFHALSCVDILAFGSECGTISDFSSAASLLLNEPDEWNAELKQLLCQGNSYPKALGLTIKKHRPEHELSAGLLESPNNLLGLEYVKALQKLSSTIQPYTVTRTGTGYHDTHAAYSDAAGTIIASASAIRNALTHFSADNTQNDISSAIMPDDISDCTMTNGCSAATVPNGCLAATMPNGCSAATMQHDGLAGSMKNRCSGNAAQTILTEAGTGIQALLPPDAYRVFSESHGSFSPVVLDDFSLLLSARIAAETKDSLASFLDVPKELADRIYRFQDEFLPFSGLIAAIKHKQFTHARINRALLHILLGLKEMPENASVPYARLLALKKNASPLMKELKEHSTIPIITKPATARKILTGQALKLFLEDVSAADLYQRVVCAKSGTTLPFVSDIKKKIEVQ